MANTIRDNYKIAEITGISADWLWSDTYPGTSGTGIKLHSIEFKPGGVGDRINIVDAEGDIPALMDCSCKDAYDDKIKYFPGHLKFKPKLVFADGTYSAGSKIIITTRD